VFVGTGLVVLNGYVNRKIVQYPVFRFVGTGLVVLNGYRRKKLNIDSDSIIDQAITTGQNL